MAPLRPSLLRSIGDVLHISRSTESTEFTCPSRSGSLTQGLPLKVFEDTLATRLRSLVCIEETQILSVEWLKDAMQVLIATNLDAQAFIPEVQLPLSERDEKWMKDYLEYSSLVLEMCNMIEKDIAGIEKILMLVKRLVHMLNSQSSSDGSELSRAQDSLGECITALKSHGSAERNQKKDHHLLEDMAKKFLCAKSEHLLKKNAFGKVCFAAKLTTIVICSIVVTAFSGQNFLLVELSLPEFFAWSLPFLALQRTIKAVITERMDKGLNFLIPELCNVEFCLTKLKPLLDQYGNKGVVTILMESRERTPPLVGDLKKGSEVIENSLKSLEGEMERFFRLTIENRNALLDKFRG